MLVHKYYCRPANPESETLALDEIARYVQARNRLLRLSEKWGRIRDEIILPEYRAIASTLRSTPRVGRKPKKVRSDREELRAADSRALYAEFIAAGGSYATWWLAEAASKKAKRPVEDEYAGRAGMLPQRLVWEGSILHYAGTAWSVHAPQLKRHPVPEHARIAQAWLQRERTESSLLRRPWYKWFLVLVFDVSPRMHNVLETRTAAGVDIAWRQDDDTLRVAYIANEAGAHRPIRMPALAYGQLEHAASIERLADEDANRLRAELGVPANTSHRRLLELAPGHPTGEHMVHLMQWNFGQRRNAIASRDAHYLQEVHTLLAAHHTVYIEQIKGSPRLVQRAHTRKKKGAGEKAVGGVAREQRQLAAPFTFLRLIQREAPKFGTEVIEVPAEYTSRICAACETDLGPSHQRERSCGGCGQRWDIDHLAALNLLRWGAARKADDNAAE